MFEKLLEAISGLTAALLAHTAALAANPTSAPAATRRTKAVETLPAASTAGSTAIVAGQAATSNPVQSAATTSASVAAVTSQEAGAAMVRVANEISREAAVAILAKHGAQTFAGVKPELYSQFKADCDAALAPPAAAPAGAAGLL